MLVKTILKKTLPPFLMDMYRAAKQAAKRQPVEWEYIPDTRMIERANKGIKGWNVQDIPEIYEA